MLVKDYLTWTEGRFQDGLAGVSKSSRTIKQMEHFSYRYIGVPSAHAWRRGWAVQALRNGVSETSVRAAAGWSSGAMVAR